MIAFDKIHEELSEYIKSKIPDVDICIQKEIAIYAVDLFVLREGDVLAERDKEWKKSLRLKGV